MITMTGVPGFDLDAAKTRLEHAFRHRLDRKIKDVLREEAEEVATGGKLRAPVNKDPRIVGGTLRESIHAEEPEDGPNGPQVRVVAGEGLSYARIQHENEDYEHDVGESHFLTKAVDEQRPTITRNVRRAMREAVEEG